MFVIVLGFSVVVKWIIVMLISVVSRNIVLEGSVSVRMVWVDMALLLCVCGGVVFNCVLCGFCFWFWCGVVLCWCDVLC